MEEDREKIKAVEEQKQSEIIRDPIIAFLIVKIRNNHSSSYINTIPITTDWCNFNEDNSISINEEIIGVVPAPQYSYMVSGLFPHEGVKYPDNGTYKSLGYEFKGAYFPDWKNELERRIKNGGTKENLGNEEDITNDGQMDRGS